MRSGPYASRNSRASLRAVGRFGAATESSRSRISASAPLSKPRASLRSLSAGTNSSERIMPRAGLVRSAGRLPGHHLPAAALIGPDIGEADAKGIRLAARHYTDLAGAGQNDGVAEILRLDIRRHHRGVHGRARFHIADQALLGVEPGRGVGVNKIVGDQLVELSDVLLRHRLHALAVEIDNRLPVACHIPSSSRLSGPSAP